MTRDRGRQTLPRITISTEKSEELGTQFGKSQQDGTRDREVGAGGFPRPPLEDGTRGPRCPLWDVVGRTAAQSRDQCAGRAGPSEGSRAGVTAPSVTQAISY